MKILVCDDQHPEGIREQVKQAEEASGRDWDMPPSLDNEALGTALRDFLKSVNALISGALPDAPQTGFDEADVLLLDFGLTKLQDFSVRLTAEHLAGYLRAFSDVAYVVSLNKLPSVDFDLKYLLGDFDTRADLALNTDHLSEPGLWTGQPRAGAFCPWYWPTLERAGERRRKQIEIVKENLDRPILGVLGFPDDVVPLLSRQAIGFLSPLADEAKDAGRDVREITFWHHFQNSSRTLPDVDREDIVRKRGGSLDGTECPKCPDDPMLRIVVARVVAGELDFWFRRDILGPQNLLVDAPHLQARMRFRTDGAAGDVEQWSRTATELESPNGLDAGLYAAIPEPARFSGWPWLDRPAFWLDLFERLPEIEKLGESVERASRMAFCEDIRRFDLRGGDNPPRRFVTELTKGIDVRFVKIISEKTYAPVSQFAR